MLGFFGDIPPRAIIFSVLTIIGTPVLVMRSLQDWTNLLMLALMWLILITFWWDRLKPRKN